MSARAFAVIVACLLGTAPAAGRDLVFIPVPERVGRADVVLVGTVAEVEKDAVEVAPFGGKKTRYRVARVAVTDPLFNVGKAKELRVAFIGAEDQPDDGLNIPTPVLEKDNEVILFLRKFRSADDLCVIDGHFGAVGKKPTGKYLAAKLDEVTKEAKEACRVVADAAAALSSEKDEERMLAAWMLTARYRAYPMLKSGERIAEEKVAADESRGILEGLMLLAEKRPHEFFRTAYSLSLSKEDGFEQPFTPEKAAAWLKDNAKTYRVKKYVPAAK